MSTSLGMVALCGFLLNPAPGEQTLWWRDYQLAKAHAHHVGKPLAVVIGSGPTGYHQVSRQGQLPDDLLSAYRQRYVWVYLDVDQHAALVKTFEVRSGRGLIISDRTGDLQAFFHDGQLSNDLLTTYLTRFAAPNAVVHSTVVHREAAPPYTFAAQSSANTTSYYRPVQSTTPNYNYSRSSASPYPSSSFPLGSSSFGGSYAPVRSGGAPAGNC